MRRAFTVMLILTERRTSQKTQILRQNLRLVTKQKQDQEQGQSHQTKSLGKHRRRFPRKARRNSPRTLERNCWRKRSQPGTS